MKFVALGKSELLKSYGAKQMMHKALVAIFIMLSSTHFVRAEPVSLLALGDSLTAGYGLPEEDGFTAQLEEWLVGKGYDVVVINGGVSGDTTAGGLARTEWSLTDDVDAVMIELGANDLLRGLPPENARQNLDGILKSVSKRDLPVLLAGIPAPPNYGAEYKESFDAIYPELAQQYNAVYYPNFLIGLGREIADIRVRMQSDGLHPNAEGVGLIVEHIGPFVVKLLEGVNASE